MGTEVTTIPIIRQVLSTTYALLPVTGLRPGDLGYATDRKTLYRWSGAAWEAITIYASSGLAAAIPAAADLPAGSLYFETDTGLLKQVQGGAWVSISFAVASGTYVGNAAADRAIPHGIGSIPKVVFIANAVAYQFKIMNMGAQARIECLAPATSITLALMDATNIYVGNAVGYAESANANGVTYNWCALP